MQIKKDPPETGEHTPSVRRADRTDPVNPRDKEQPQREAFHESGIITLEILSSAVLWTSES